MHPQTISFTLEKVNYIFNYKEKTVAFRAAMKCTKYTNYILRKSFVIGFKLCKKENFSLCQHKPE